MKKIALLFLLLGISLGSCNKDDDHECPTSNPYPYETKLAGAWDLVAVEYATEIPDLLGGGAPIPVEGTGTNVSGDFTLTRNPNEVDYSFAFTATVDLGTGFPIPIPVNFSGNGTWTTTTDESKVIIQDETLGEELILDVVENENNRQVFESTMTQNFQGLSLEVGILLTFERDN